jgi:hypothetical protein
MFAVLRSTCFIRRMCLRSLLDFRFFFFGVLIFVGLSAIELLLVQKN